MEYPNNKQRLRELDKLEKYLSDHNYIYERIDKEYVFGNRHGVIVYNEEHTYMWDAICHLGSYGYEEGLLEIMGTIVDPEAGDSVEGWLTADEIISRLEDM